LGTAVIEQLNNKIFHV